MKKTIALLLAALTLTLLFCGCAGGESADGKGKTLRTEETAGGISLSRTYRFDREGNLTDCEATLRYPDESSAEQASRLYAASPELYAKVTLAGSTLSVTYTEEGLGEYAGKNYATLREQFREAGILR